MSQPKSSGPAPSPEELIGRYVIGFIGDPAAVKSDEKWSLYDALTSIDSILGEIVRETWAQLEVSKQLDGSHGQETTQLGGADSSSRDRASPS